MGIPREHSIGRYELLIELGRGGMAELFLGRLHGAGGFAKLVAIKRILPHLAQDKQFTEMFLNEGQIASRLSHPNVCQVFELGDAGGELFLAMEYLDGVSWEHLLAVAPRMDTLALAAGVIAQAADGLHYAHTLRDVEGKPTPIVHRDVSPQNLFVTIDGVCKVLDFGVSKMMTDGPRTSSGVIKGKLPYMAPEQIRGEGVDARADVFSLGVCTWEALAGARLFDRGTDFQIWKAITEEDVAPIASRWHDCPPAVDELVHRALDREAANRPRSARVFADELRERVPDAWGTAAIGDAVRRLCADRIAARAKQVATAVSSRRSGPIAEHVATADDSRSAASTIDARPPRPDEPEASLAGETLDIRMRDKSLVVRRDEPSRVVDSRLVPGKRSVEQSVVDLPPRSTRLGLVIGGLAAVLVIAAVVVVAKCSPADPKLANEQVVAPRDARSSPAPVAVVAADAALAVAADAARASPPTPDAAVAIGSGHPHRPPPRTGSAAPGRPESPRVGSGSAVATPTAEPGFYSVDSTPYATIYVDGKRLGDTPLFRESLASGAHQIRAVRADGREQSFAIRVPPGRELNSGKLAW